MSFKELVEVEDPTVSFIIPTLNEEQRLGTCLKTIRDQDYPRGKVEIIIADGGSHDATRVIAAQYHCRIVDNERRLAEPGVALGMCLSTSDLNVIMATDNILPRKDWLKRMVKPFLVDPEIMGSYTHVANDHSDNSFNRYFNLLHADPLNWFVYQAAANPKRFAEIYPGEYEGADYTVYSFDVKRFPLLALAQGFVLRGDITRSVESDYDDIIPIIELIRTKAKLAYVPVGIYHFSFKGFTHFLVKYRKRANNALNRGYVQRIRYFSKQRRYRQWLWAPYSLSLIWPFTDAWRLFRQSQDIAAFYHPLACLGLTLIIGEAILKQPWSLLGPRVNTIRGE